VAAGLNQSTMKAITIKRELLLAEIVRHCSFPECNAKVSIGLAKSDVLDYRGFECTHCKRWSDDTLSAQDIPDWWQEINSRGIYS
jgi:hypothetical protein